MKVITFINPIKLGKVSEYKAFAADITGKRKSEFTDLLRRYHLNTSEVWYHQIAGQDYVIVRHEIDDDVVDPLANWATSTHPFDRWFQEQLSHLHDMEGVKIPEMLFQVDVE